MFMLKHTLCYVRIPDPTAIAAVAAMDLRADNWRTAAHLLFTGGLAGRNGTEPGPGVVIYLLPMGSGQTKGGSSHGWGDPLHSFWCCYGTSVESFAKLADSIFFFRHADRPLLSHASLIKVLDQTHNVCCKRANPYEL